MGTAPFERGVDVRHRRHPPGFAAAGRQPRAITPPGTGQRIGFPGAGAVITREKPACWTPHPGDDCWASGRDPLLIMAMDHGESFGRALFGVRHDDPGAAQRAAVTAAKRLIHAGPARARAELPRGRARFRGC
jgi:hypothetical protein